MRKPKIGDIVIFTGKNLFKKAAIVTHVHNNAGQKEPYDLCLFVISDNGTHHTMATGFSGEPEENSWSWPEEEKQCTCPTEVKASYTLCPIHDGKQEEKKSIIKECGYCGERIIDKEYCSDDCQKYSNEHKQRHREEKPKYSQCCMFVSNLEKVCKECGSKQPYVNKEEKRCNHEWIWDKSNGPFHVLKCAACHIIKSIELKKEESRCEHNFDCLNLDNNKLHCGKCHVEKPVQTNKAEELIEELLSKIVYSIYKYEKVGISFCADEMCKEIESLIKEYKGIK